MIYINANIGDEVFKPCIVVMQVEHNIINFVHSEIVKLDSLNKWDRLVEFSKRVIEVQQNYPEAKLI